jgi:hypothetical protein
MFAHFGCRPKLPLTACRSLKGRETEPSGEVAATSLTRNGGSSYSEEPGMEIL